MKNRRRITARRTVLATLSVIAAATIGACGGGNSADVADSNTATSQALAVSSSLPPPPPFVPLATPLPADASEYDKQIQIARISGPGNEGMYPENCISGGQDPALQNRNVVPITQLFDDLYFLGTYSVGLFVMKTQDGGFIVFDTMNNATDVNNIVVPQLQSAGIDPATLRGIVVTHGHGDHDGGASRLQTLFNPATTVVGSADYTANKTYIATVKVDSAQPGLLVPISIGGKEFAATATPGHTAGTTSYFLPVTFQGKQHTVLYVGGSGVPGSAAGVTNYVRSVERLYAQAKALNADASINSHTFFDKSIDRITKIRTDGFVNGNPMIQTNAKILASLATLRQCMAARLATMDATARNPVWRPTTTDVYAGKVQSSATNGKKVVLVAARVSNYFSVLSGVEVAFTDSNQAASCKATTNAEGIATCSLLYKATPPGQPVPQGPLVINAQSAGLVKADGVELDSTGSLTLQGNLQ